MRVIKESITAKYGSKKAKEIVEDDAIRVINIYNEKEDFMWWLFGVDTISQETIDYWGE